MTKAMLALIAASSVALAAKPFFEESTVWEHKEDGLWPHMVYAVVVTGNDTVLAVSEGRIEPGDDAPHHLVLKRSTDKGKTWSDDIRLETSDGKQNWANPSAVVDPKTNRAFVFYVLNQGGRDQITTRVFYKSSVDDGLTWSDRVELTALFKTNPIGWSFFMPGPGHGIALARQKDRTANGRLVVPFWSRRQVTAPKRQYGVMMLISDDGGRKWKLGGVAGMDHGINESRIVELADGRLLLNGRGSDPQHNGGGVDTRMQRIYAESADGGRTFAPSAPRNNLRAAQVDCSMVGYQVDAKRHALLFSFPAGRKQEQSPKAAPNPETDHILLEELSRTAVTRSNMTVAVSFDEGKTWPHRTLIHEGGAVYSDLVVFRNKTIGLIYGKDRPNDEGWNRAFPQKVAFVRFNFEYLTQGEKK